MSELLKAIRRLGRPVPPYERLPYERDLLLPLWQALEAKHQTGYRYGGCEMTCEGDLLVTFRCPVYRMLYLSLSGEELVEAAKTMVPGELMDAVAKALLRGILADTASRVLVDQRREPKP